MEDFLTSFFITPFTGLAEGIATATSPLDVIDASMASCGALS